jgi:fumarate reductase subunit C
MSDSTIYTLQRITAIILAGLVAIHLALIIYAIDGGMTAGEILSRTRASLFWPMFYGVFVIAITIHAPLGLRNILLELTKINHRPVNALSLAFALMLLLLGARAVWGIS